MTAPHPVPRHGVCWALGRWNQSNSPWVKASLALMVVAMSFGLLYTL